MCLHNTLVRALITQLTTSSQTLPVCEGGSAITPAQKERQCTNPLPGAQNTSNSAPPEPPCTPLITHNIDPPVGESLWPGLCLKGVWGGGGCLGPKRLCTKYDPIRFVLQQISFFPHHKNLGERGGGGRAKGGKGVTTVGISNIKAQGCLWPPSAHPLPQHPLNAALRKPSTGAPRWGSCACTRRSSRCAPRWRRGTRRRRS